MHDLARVLALLFVTLFNLVVLFVWDPLFKIHAPFGMPPPQPVDPPLCTPQYQDCTDDLCCPPLRCINLRCEVPNDSSVSLLQLEKMFEANKSPNIMNLSKRLNTSRNTSGYEFKPIPEGIYF
ncbi:uncharacterized protein LOC124371978 isoform X1 [Homalodisca vitripennis]|uniref:uncharacterized protein LOC124371978 isoform X1 n=1 Tax=Homalodisca vitripennis TaxID=197043 RepID=UPI001EEBE4F1|nr:uncharacterized protein LOC124371978 isoform X1 [Homalodisca vitripennis]